MFYTILQYLSSIPFIGGAFIYLDNKKQSKDTCEALHKGIDDKFDIILVNQDKVMKKIDDVNYYLRNNR